MTGAGLAGLAFFGWPVRRAWQARSWPQVQGTVVRVHLESQEGVAEGPRDRPVRIEYGYTVDGKKYLGTRITFFDIAQSHRPRCKPGSSLVVRYSPSDPSDAVIDTDIPLSLYGAVWFSALFVAGGIITAIRLFLAIPAGVP